MQIINGFKYGFLFIILVQGGLLCQKILNHFYQITKFGVSHLLARKHHLFPGNFPKLFKKLITNGTHYANYALNNLAKHFITFIEVLIFIMGPPGLVI